MNSLTITLNDLRQIDGLIYEANSAGMSVKDFALLTLSREGSRFAATTSKLFLDVIIGSLFPTITTF